MNRVIEKVAFPVPTAPKLTRVAAYARVSSAKDTMLHSLSAQVSHYNSLTYANSSNQTILVNGCYVLIG